MQLVRFLFLMLSLYLLPLGVGAQSIDIDSLEAKLVEQTDLENYFQTFQKIYTYYSNRDLDKTLSYVNLANEKVKQTGDAEKMNIINGYYAFVFTKKGKTKDALQKWNECVIYAKQTNNDQALLENYVGKSRLFLQISKPDSVTYYATKCLNLASILKDTAQIIRANLTLGQVVVSLENYEDAVNYFTKANQLAHQLDNGFLIGASSNGLGVTYFNWGDFIVQEDSSKFRNYYNKALKYYFETEREFAKLNNQQYLGIINNNIGSIYLGLGKWQKAKSYLAKALKALKSYNNPAQVFETQSNLAAALSMLGERAKALKYLQKSLAFFKKQKDDINVKNIYEKLGILYFNHQEYKKAALYRDSLAFSLMKINRKDTRDAIKELEVKYKADKQLKEIELLDSENELISTKLSHSKKRNLGLGIGFLLLLLASFWLYQLYRKNKIQKQIIEQSLEEKSVLIREVHHRVKNNLQIINSILSLQSRYLKEDCAKKAVLDGRNRVKAMSLIHQNLYSENNLKGVNIQLYFDKLLSSLLYAFQVDEQRIKIEMNIPSLIIDVETVIPLGLIVNEILSNVFKHAFLSNENGILKFDIDTNDNDLIIKIEDNGKGIGVDFDLDDIDTLGYRLINSFKHKLDAEISVKDNNGTHIQLIIHDFKKNR